MDDQDDVVGAEMVTIATFANAIEAEMAKNRLAEEHIPAFVLGETSGTLFSGMTNLLGSIRLQVTENNADRALAILEGESGEDIDEGPEPEPSTAIKAPEWARAPAGSAAGSTDPSIQSPPGVKEVADPDADLRGVDPDEEGDTDDEKDEDPYRVTWGPDDYAVRAWKVAGIGLLLLPPLWMLALPPVLHVYSAWYLLQLFSMPEKPSPAAKRKAYLALVIDALAIGLWPLVCCSGGLRHGFY